MVVDLVSGELVSACFRLRTGKTSEIAANNRHLPSMGPMMSVNLYELSAACCWSRGPSCYCPEQVI